ncbi:MAG TPA: hypothetical protein VIV12_03625 [Streptosporangiaceae bacterium]
MATRSDSGERVDLTVSGLLGMGLTLIRTAAERPGPAPGGRLERPTRRKARLTASDVRWGVWFSLFLPLFDRLKYKSEYRHC